MNQNKLEKIVTSPTMFFLHCETGKMLKKETVLSITHRMLHLHSLSGGDNWNSRKAWNGIINYLEKGIRDWDSLAGVNNPIVTKSIIISDEKPLISEHCIPYIPKIVLDFLTEYQKEDSLTLARLKNGMAKLVYLEDVPFGTIGTIIGGYYKGLKGQLCYMCEDSGSYYGVIKILEGDDNGVFMCYLWGDHNFIKPDKKSA